MNFFDHLKQQAETLNNSGGNFSDEKVDYPTVQAERVYLSNKTPTHIGRVLPSIEMVNGTGGDFATTVRSIFFPNPIPGAKPQNVNLNLAPEKDVNSPMEQELSRWADDGLLVGRYGAIYPRTSFLVNFIPYMDNGQGTYVPAVGQDGLPKLQVIELPQSAYVALVNHVVNPLLSPVLPSTGQKSDTSFLSLESSILIEITKAKQGEKAHTVNAYGQYQLGDIRGQVEHKMDSLTTLQYTTESVNPGLTQHIIDTINGTKSDNAQAPAQPQANAQQAPAYPPYPQAPQAPVQQAPTAPPMQQAPVQQAPQVPTQPQAPVAPQAPVQQAPTAPPATPQAPTAPQAPVQQASQAPTTPQAPPAPGANGVSPEQQALMDSLRGGLM